MIPSNSKVLFLACLIVILTASFAGGASGFTVVGKDQLKQELGKQDVIIIDVRTASSWDSSPWKVQGARRESPAQVSEWATRYPKDQTIVLYCA
jgi:rhodanese-related sulfurtransferase